MTGPRGPEEPEGAAPVPGAPLDTSQDPDRFDGGVARGPSGALDMSQDPDRFRPPPAAYAGQTLTDLLGEGAQEDERDSWTWLVGLLSVLAFLALVAFLVGQLGP